MVIGSHLIQLMTLMRRRRTDGSEQSARVSSTITVALALPLCQVDTGGHRYSVMMYSLSSVSRRPGMLLVFILIFITEFPFVLLPSELLSLQPFLQGLVIILGRLIQGTVSSMIIIAQIVIVAIIAYRIIISQRLTRQRILPDPHVLLLAINHRRVLSIVISQIV